MDNVVHLMHKVIPEEILPMSRGNGLELSSPVLLSLKSQANQRSDNTTS